MSVTLQQIGQAGGRVFAGTLTGNANVHDALIAVAEQHQIIAGVVQLLGGLTLVELTAYDFVRKTRYAPHTLEGALEIVGGYATLSLLDDKPHVHWHAMLAYRDQANTPHLIGGHCARALAFAVEFTVLAWDGQALARAPHASTGLALWNLPPL